MANRAFLYIFFFSFHIYIIHAHLSESSANFATPLKFLDELNGVQKGKQQEGVDKAKKYLAYFGYMLTCPRNFINNESKNTVDKCFELALKKYQKFYHLKITGVLDDATQKKMRQPRCAMPDFYPTKKNTTTFHEHYAFSGFPPLKKDKLTYAMKDVKPEHKPLIERAIKQWESATHFKFSRAKYYSGADIRLSFKRGDHNDNVPFTGEHATSLGHTLDDGRIHFNEAMNWSEYDIESVALHELGHALRLGHSEIEQAIMYSVIGPGMKKGLHQDDIDGIRALYHK